MRAISLRLSIVVPFHAPRWRTGLVQRCRPLVVSVGVVWFPAKRSNEQTTRRRAKLTTYKKVVDVLEGHDGQLRRSFRAAMLAWMSVSARSVWIAISSSVRHSWNLPHFKVWAASLTALDVVAESVGCVPHVLQIGSSVPSRVKSVT